MGEGVVGRVEVQAAAEDVGGFVEKYTIASVRVQLASNGEAEARVTRTRSDNDDKGGVRSKTSGKNKVQFIR